MEGERERVSFSPPVTILSKTESNSKQPGRKITPEEKTPDITSKTKASKVNKFVIDVYHHQTKKQTKQPNKEYSCKKSLQRPQ